jgi:hypothetical protein
VYRGFKLFWHISWIMNNLPRPDLLYTMQISMLHHFVNTHRQLDTYNVIWLSVAAYQDFTPENKSYEDVSEWYGEEITEMRQYLLGVVTQSQREGSPMQYPRLNCVIECTQASLELYMYVQSRSHNNATLSYKEDTLCYFHTFKDVF